MRTKDIARTVSTKLLVAEQLAGLDPYVWYDNAASFNCCEANTIADFLATFVSPETAISFLAQHASDDDEGDVHQVVSVPPLQGQIFTRYYPASRVEV